MGGIRGLRLAGEQWNVRRRRLRRVPRFRQVSYADRATTGLPQVEFARTISAAKGTLLNWEHGRRHLISPAQVLLAMIAKRPSLVGEVLS